MLLHSAIASTATTASSDWPMLPEPLLLAILQQLDIRDILSASQTCQNWCHIARDDYLWRQLFRRDFRIRADVPLKPGMWGEWANERYSF